MKGVQCNYINDSCIILVSSIHHYERFLVPYRSHASCMYAFLTQPGVCYGPYWQARVVDIRRFNNKFLVPATLRRVGIARHTSGGKTGQVFEMENWKRGRMGSGYKYGVRSMIKDLNKCSIKRDSRIIGRSEERVREADC